MRDEKLYEILYSFIVALISLKATGKLARADVMYESLTNLVPTEYKVHVPKLWDLAERAVENMMEFLDEHAKQETSES